MIGGWKHIRKLILRGPDPGADPYRLAFEHVCPTGDYPSAYTGFQRTLGGDGFTRSFPYPFNNPIGNGIVFREQGQIFGPPPAMYAFGTFFFAYPSPGQSIPEVVQPGGPLYDPQTLAALLGNPQEGIGTTPTTPAIGAAQAGAMRMNHSF